MTNLYNLTHEQLQQYFINQNQNVAKAKIIYRQLYREKLMEISRIKELSKRIVDKVCSDFYLNLPKCIKQVGDEKVEKFLFELEDGNTIETVLMRQEYGNSVCISTQIGCNMGCKFCESGKHKLKRNLTTAEMVGQIMYIKNKLDVEVKTITIMGIGEPFENYENVLKFIDIMTSDYGLCIGKRHITVSTCGIVPKIYDYSNRVGANSLAISLHAPNDELRTSLMPINKAYSISKLKESLKLYTEKTNNKVFVEYVMLNNINDSLQCAQQLAEFCADFKCTVNLIPYNETHSLDFKRSEFNQIMAFYDVLKKNRIHVTMRRELGSNVKAACGQLKNEN